MSSQIPLPAAPRINDVLAALPATGISIDNLIAKLWKRTLSDRSKAELLRALDPIATFDAATGLWKPRPRHKLIPGHIESLVSRPRKRRRVRPFSSKWISGSGDVISHVHGDYDPVWRKHDVRGLLSREKESRCYRHVCIQVLLNSSPAVLDFLNTHKILTRCSFRDCLTCSLADLAEEYTGLKTVTLPDVLDSFYELCDKTFWGPRARAKRRVGPMTDVEGDLDVSFFLFLLYNMREQLLRCPRYVFGRQIAQTFANPVAVIYRNSSESSWLKKSTI